MQQDHYWIKCFLLLAVVLVLCGVVLHTDPIAQSVAYHDFADKRTFFSIPNALNVLSNLPFLAVAIMALIFLQQKQSEQHFATPHEKRYYRVYFSALAFVAVGSSYYHLHPNNNTLVWDRLPMTVAFMSIFVALLAERVSTTLAKIVFVPLIILGIFSVWYWHYTQMLGYGDLRLYFAVQFFPLLLLPLMLMLFKARYSGVENLYLALLFYLSAKLFEIADKPLMNFFHQSVSGHTLKHCLAALGCFYILLYIKHRRVITASCSS